MNLRQRHSIPAIWAAPTPERGAFTLMELMVAVAILSVMIVIFSGILSQVQQVMNLSNDAIRRDRIVVAVDKLLRRDIVSISKGGFLKITGGNHIAFAAVGSFESMESGGTWANAATIDYGLTTAADDALVAPGGDDTPPEKVIWRRLHLLIPGGSGSDQIDASLAESGQSVNQPFYAGGVRKAPEIRLPPTQASHWGTYVAENCTEFQVFWWNGTAWSTADGSWTAGSNWPKALRIRYTLEGKLFEIITNIE